MEAAHPGNLLPKDPVFSECLNAPRVLGAVRHPRRPAPHTGGWNAEVASVAFAGPEGMVLIDPLVSDWNELDELVAGRPVSVVLTAAWHERSSADVARRYAAPVYVHEAGRERVNSPPARLFTGGPVVAGVEAMPVPGSDEGQVALWLPTKRAVVSAEVLTGSDAGLRIAESPLLRSRDELEAWIEQLAALRSRSCSHRTGRRCSMTAARRSQRLFIALAGNRSRVATPRESERRRRDRPRIGSKQGSSDEKPPGREPEGWRPDSCARTPEIRPAHPGSAFNHPASRPPRGEKLVARLVASRTRRLAA